MVGEILATLATGDVVGETLSWYLLDYDWLDETDAPLQDQTYQNY